MEKPTAEAIFKTSVEHHAKSAGTEPGARIKIIVKLINWADIIFAMGKRHEQRIIENFPFETADKPVIVLEIADEYRYMDEELIATIQLSVEPYLGAL